ncbi:aminotransferase class I/II-fold pyridoxal phosphate-dependent enzyme [Solihabitans fulvus]|uniref:homocysteine desulfhydrase n=1 Tax=Solihabitans fulvus TaxID=1892852 RepID=A0A5B2XD27_9PSEU|nr:aminotransferase class I/II-fold pyridoxal phosphate-dependent enzyme [Solihabitans fulvus]KAA2261084.1 aminotransferase class I/II-fold pyridoxal phosphate-dependent enzyme [Solihabitans fulvus]
MPSRPAADDAVRSPIRALHQETRAVHVAAAELVGCRPLSVPLYQTSSFAFDDPAALAEAMSGPDGAFVYTRRGNPTVRALENTVAALEGGAAALATASGMGAISSVLLSLLRSGDHVIAQRCLYGGTFALFGELAERFGIEVSHVGGQDPDEVRRALRPRSRVLYLETIANPMTQVCDLPALIDVGRAHGLISVVDNSFASPLLCRPLEHGADVVVHSTTKYLGGHSDVLGGVAVFATEEQHLATWSRAVELGASADPFAAWLTIRGLQTLPLRMRAHCANAEFLAHRLAAHPAVRAVHWPGLSDHPDHLVAKRLLAGYGGVLAFDLAGGRGAGQMFISSVELASLAVSLGGVETLVLHPASTSHRELDEVSLRAAGIGPGTVRVAVGLEHRDDLWRDFEQALARCA